MIGFALIALCLGFCFLLQRLHLYRATSVPYVIAAWLGLTAAEQSNYLTVPLYSQFVQQPEVYEVIEQNAGGLVEMPIGFVRSSIMWQTFHHQPTFGGMGENVEHFVPPGHKLRRDHPLFGFLARVVHFPQRNLENIDQHLLFLKQQGFRYLVLDRAILEGELRKKRTPVMKKIIEIEKVLIHYFGDPWAVDGPLVVWNFGEPGYAVEAVAFLDPERTPLRTLWVQAWKRCAYMIVHALSD